VTLTTPNVVTLGRIALLPLLMWLLTFTGPTASALAAGTFLVAAVSDYVDGYIARSYDAVSVLGKFLDPMADKLIISGVLIMLAGMNRVPRVPAWIVAVIVGREIFVTALRAMAASHGVVMAAEELGKYKMVLQGIAVQALLIHYTYFHVDFFAAGMFILWLALALSLWSGADYYFRLVDLLNGKSQGALDGSRFDKRRAGG
jgi:CDP-diacylglycerol--glycerol-3-phosphate 3-phosphatidyltransferase